jgi:hypothetical protein
MSNMVETYSGPVTNLIIQARRKEILDEGYSSSKLQEVKIKHTARDLGDTTLTRCTKPVGRTHTHS